MNNNVISSQTICYYVYMPIHQTRTHSHLLKDAALELVWPTRCSGCERPGDLLCDTCKAALLHIEKEHACMHCGAPFGHLICTECYGTEGKELHSFSSAVCSLELDQLSGRIIVLYKDNNERRLSPILAHYLRSSIPASWITWAEVITWVPADRKAVRRRGFDHMERIASELAHEIQLPAYNLLEKLPSRDQRGLNRQQRKENLQKSFKMHKNLSPVPSHVLLIDDVFTTGCTLDAAAGRLKEGGASEVRVACIARVW